MVGEYIETAFLVYDTVRPWSHSCAVPMSAAFNPGKTCAVSASVGMLGMGRVPDVVDVSFAPLGRAIVNGWLGTKVFVRRCWWEGGR